MIASPPPPPPAAHASATAASPSLDWLLDDEITSRISAARVDAEKQKALAAELETKRAAEVAKQQAAENERGPLETTLPALSGRKKTAAEARVAELAATASEATRRATGYETDGAAARARAAADLEFASRAEAEARLRAAQAADRIDPAQELGGLSDDRLGRGRSYWTRRLERVPSQIAAIEKELDAEPTQAGRAALLSRADGVRSERGVAAAQIDRIDEELRFRTETKQDESQQAAGLVAAAKAKASEAVPEAMTMTSARSAALDRKLDEIATLKEAEARSSEDARRARRFRMRVGGGIAILLAASLLIGIMLKRSA